MSWACRVCSYDNDDEDDSCFICKTARQDDLFEAYARNTDPDTSHEAAGSLSEEDLARMEGLALAATKRCMPAGMINDQLVQITGLPWQSITPRMKPLERKGMVERRIDPGTGKFVKRPSSRTNRGQDVWYTTKEAK